MYCVSLPIVLICLAAAFVMMLTSFWCEDYLKATYPPDDYIILLPSIVYSILVFAVNLYYRILATYLTEWGKKNNMLIILLYIFLLTENHRTQSQYDRHRVTKLVLFEFVNNFVALFYIAFIIQDMDMLKSQLQTMLIVSQLINHFQEALLPLFVKYYGSKVRRSKIYNFLIFFFFL